jgi:tripartite-type tricarboxylate transporter receptor subunit TctC
MMNSLPSRRHALRHTLSAAALALLALANPWAANAQSNYPDKPIRFVVPYPPGGGTDVIARIVQVRLQAALGQNVLIENKGGAGGSLGTDVVAKAAPDGYTVLFTLSSHTINPAIFPKLPFDTQKDFEPIGLVASLPQILVANIALPVRNVADLTAQAKAAPTKFSFASVGNGSPGHLAGELQVIRTGAPMQHIP